MAVTPKTGLTDVSPERRCGLESVMETLLSTIMEGVQLRELNGVVG